MFDIVTFGSAVADTFIDTDMAGKGGNLCYPLGSKILIKNLKFEIGGGGTNTAVAFSRLGFKTGYIGKLGEDFNGRMILDLLKKEGVQFLGKTQPRMMTGYSVILDSKQHERTVLTYKGVNDDVKISDINTKQMQTRWLYFSSLLGSSFAAQKILANGFYRNGVKIAFNPSEYAIKVLDLMPILKISEILILNKEEAELLCLKNKVHEKDLLNGLHNLGPRIIVITNKDKEVIAYDGEKKYRIIPHKIKIKERTGAGDAFASGFVAGQMAGKSIDDSLKLGLEESESVITHQGAKIGLIRRRLG
ncbi:MAG TPA: carbohydrate kinase family protein [Candidatus Omnitrophota bacterium]|nr:carbohydrate kinase family protein [Candidatus Omnitrophota bacterium]